MTTFDEIQQAAEGATKGPWAEDDGNVFSQPISNANYEARSAARRDGLPQPPRGYDGLVAKCSQELPNFDADARFITLCNPATVLAMVKALRAAEAMRSAGTYVPPEYGTGPTEEAAAFDAAMAELEKP